MKVLYSSVSGEIERSKIEINTLGDLQEFRKTIAIGQEIILSRWYDSDNDIFSIEIYDDYRE